MKPDRRRSPVRGVAAVAGLFGILLASCTSGPTTGADGTTGSSGRSVPPAASTAAGGTADLPADWVSRENARPGTRSWRIPSRSVAGDGQLSAYADRVSLLPGQPVRLFVGCACGQVRIEAFRIGDYGGAGARLLWSAARVPVGRQPAAVTDPATRLIRAPWRATTTLPTDGWPVGLYLVKLTTLGPGQADRQRYVPLLVRSASTAGRLVMLHASATYQVYNEWGGRSLYGGGPGVADFAQRSFAVSFDRPYDGDGTRKLSQYEVGPVRLAESLGLNLAYLGSADLALPGALDGARGLVSPGHDEYWSVAMRRAVEAARDRGMNLAFLGANSVYWRIRFEDSPLGPARVVVGYKDAARDPMARRDPARATVLWRGAPAPDPENSLTGTLYECFPARADYRVTDPGFALFAGTGATAATRVPGLVGAEIDRAYPIAGTPATLQVVSHTPVACGGTGRTFADSVDFTSPSGAGTFGTGTMSWAVALRGTSSTLGITRTTVSFVTTVTTNLFRAMAAGPMGAAIPARPNLASLKASSSTETGTGGAVARG